MVLGFSVHRIGTALPGFAHRADVRAHARTHSLLPLPQLQNVHTVRISPTTLPAYQTLLDVLVHFKRYRAICLFPLLYAHSRG